MTLTDLYRQKTTAGEIHDDPAQYPVLAEFERLAADLTARRLPWQKRAAVKGLYLWGGVGRGKTMLMDLAMSWLTHEKGVRCCRFHFHDFMAAVHDQVQSPGLARERDPARQVAAHIADGARVIFFDEMEIRDIADAMIVARVMGGFMESGGVLVMTSNRTPDYLYEGGLHRERFLPFINLIKERLVIHEMISETDWRQRFLDGMDGYFIGSDDETAPRLDDVFGRLTGGVEAAPVQVVVTGRKIDFDRVAGSVLAAGFDDLCKQPLSSRDYLALAERFSGVVLFAVPQLDDLQRNEARRFIWLIDALYDRGRFLVASSPVAIKDLYRGEIWAAEFPRTVSRLIEMTRINTKSVD